MSNSDLSQFSMRDLFRMEAEQQTAVLNANLLELENGAADPTRLEALMRAAHSLKGAARMVGLDPAVRVAHAMEDAFVAAQKGTLVLGSGHVDLLLRGVDALVHIAALTEADTEAWVREQGAALDSLVAALSGLEHAAVVLPSDPPSAKAPRARKSAARRTTRSAAAPEEPPAPTPAALTPPATAPAEPAPEPEQTAVRVSATQLTRLMALSGEAVVQSRWLHGYNAQLLQVRRHQARIAILIERALDVLGAQTDPHAHELLLTARATAREVQDELAQKISDLEQYDRRVSSLAKRLNGELVASRMRPFADGMSAFPRMVRDLARSLGKSVALEVKGLNTPVDRDILERIEAPLNHLLRNAVDHGVENPEARATAGKPAKAIVRLEAAHVAGMLSIVVEDDGRGVDLEALRAKIVARGFASATMAADLREHELMDFLFLPGFSTREQVSEVSGRGVGLDVVHSVVQGLRGQVRATSAAGRWTRFHLQLPLTLSVMRTLLVQIGGEPYALPLARIERTLKIPATAVQRMEGRQYFLLDEDSVGLVSAHQVLEREPRGGAEDTLSVVVLGERQARCGLAVERLIGERTLVVHPLDPRLGKVRDVAAASVLEDGQVTLILDVDDLMRSMDILIAGGQLDKVEARAGDVSARARQRVLIVDDSITVREVERGMLEGRGYAVDVAVDGMDGWNALRSAPYDLVVSDVDMPRMNGFELVRLIKADPHLKHVPVIIVSYKDREEDRRQGLEAGADYYLTKGSFDDETLIEAVADLLGEA